MSRKNLILGIIASILSCFFFRTDLVFGKKLLENFSPITIAFLTLFIAGIVTLIDLEQRHELKSLITIKPNERWHVLMVGVLSAVIVPVVFFLGLKYTSGVNVSLFINISTIILILFGIFFLHEKITYYAVIGIVLMLGGIAAISTNGFQEQISFSKGDLFIFLLAFIGAATTIFIKKYSIFKQPHLFVSTRSILGSVILGPIVFLTKPNEIMNVNLIVEYLPTFIAYAFFVVLMGYLLEFWAIKQIPLSIYSITLLVSPVIGILYSIIFLKEQLLLPHILGSILILGGLFISMLHQHQTKHPHHHAIPHDRHIHHG